MAFTLGKTDHEEDRPVVNIANRLRETAHRMPYKRAVVALVGRDRAGRAAYAHLTFEQLDRESDSLAAGLAAIGIQRGMRTVLMVKPGIAFFVLIFAMFKCGAVPVVVDPGMGIGRMLRCLASTRPTGFIGVPLAQALRIGTHPVGGTVVLELAISAAVEAVFDGPHDAGRNGRHPLHHRQHRPGQRGRLHPW